jgi:hypothetical protein
MTTVDIFYFGPFNLFCYSPFRLYLPPPHFSTAFHINPYIIYLYILCNVILLMLWHSLLLSTVRNMFYIWDCIRSYCFSVHIYLWICLPYMTENMQPLCFWSWLTSINMISSNCIHLPSNHMSLWLSNIPLCMYTTFYWSIYQLQGTWVISKACLLWIVLW